MIEYRIMIIQATISGGSRDKQFIKKVVMKGPENKLVVVRG